MSIIPKQSKFYLYVEKIFAFEGGVNKKILSWDRGGLTNYGVRYDIFIRHLKKYYKHDFYLQGSWERFHSFDKNGHAFFDVKKYTKKDHAGWLKENDVRFFYYKDYYEPIKADSLPLGVDFYAFDFTIHSGQGNAIKPLQKIVGVVQDAFVGKKTLNAVNDFIELHGIVEIKKVIEIDGESVIKIEKHISHKVGIKELLKRYAKARRNHVMRGNAWSKARAGMENRLAKAINQSYEVINDIYIDDRKPLTKSKTLKTSKNIVAASSATLAVGTAIQESNVSDTVVRTLPMLVDNLNQVDMITKLIQGISGHGWQIILIAVICVAGLLSHERISKYFRDEK